MRTVFLYFLPFILVAGCFRIFDDYTSPGHHKEFSAQQSELVIKSGTHDGSSANIYEVEVTVNAPVFKKLIFSITSKYPMDIDLHVFSDIRLNLASLLHSAQLLFLSHCLLLL